MHFEGSVLMYVAPVITDSPVVAKSLGLYLLPSLYKRDLPP